MFDPRANLALLRRLVGNLHNIYFSEFDMDFKPISSTAPFADGLFLFLSIDEKDAKEPDGYQVMDRVITPETNTRVPAVCTNSLGMLWISELEYQEDVPERIHVVGPVFTDDYSLPKIEMRLAELNLSAPVRHTFLDFINDIPVVSLVRMYEYATMLHQCISEEPISIADLNHDAFQDTLPTFIDAPQMDAHGIFSSERAILQCVTDGNLQYKKDYGRLVGFGSSVTFAGETQLRQSKNAVLTFTALCCRAAIQGGLSPDVSYMLCGQYSRSIENSTSISAITELSHAMLDDYIHRVHNIRIASDISPQIQRICDILSIDPEKKLDIHALARQLGYTDYYFTKKFCAEVGMSIREYDTRKKIEYAQTLLRNGQLTIGEISDRLCFCSMSHFGTQFRKYTGTSPSEYRKNIQ